MTPDIFSSFDPSNLASPSFNISPSMAFLPLILTLVLFAPAYWTLLAPSLQAPFLLMNFMWRQLTQTNSTHLKAYPSLLTPLFTTLISLNILGLAPYIFSLTSHLMISLAIGLPLWLSLISSSILMNPYMFVASLLPSGAPSWLNPFLNLVETTSINLRPLTLSFRLAANMTAGHVVLTLMSAYLTFKALSISLIMALISFSAQIMYICFEMMICFVQSFIFCLLLSLYSNEHSAPLL